MWWIEKPLDYSQNFFSRLLKNLQFQLHVSRTISIFESNDFQKTVHIESFDCNVKTSPETEDERWFVASCNSSFSGPQLIKAHQVIKSVKMWVSMCNRDITFKKGHFNGCETIEKQTTVKRL